MQSTQVICRPMEDWWNLVIDHLRGWPTKDEVGSGLLYCGVRKGMGSQSVVVCLAKYPGSKSQQWVL